MTTYISILRGINVSGQKKILMADLRALYEKLGFKEVKSYIQSGNVIFKSQKELEEIETSKKIEEAIEKKYDFHVPVIIRSLSDMEKIIASNPFLPVESIDSKKLHVTFLGENPAEEKVTEIEQLDFVPDKFAIKDKEVYLHIPDSYGNTKLSNSFFEKKLKVTATTRNWTTINTLCEMASK